jgi:hypothetical protein
MLPMEPQLILGMWKKMSKRSLHKPILGDKFGKLMVVSIESGYTKGHGRLYTCLCDCGKTRILKATLLNRNQATSCGCANYLIKSNNTKYDPKMSSFRAKASHYRSNAKRAGISFDLTFEEATDIFKSNCHYCGSAPSNNYNVMSTRKSESRRILLNLEKKEDYAVKYSGIDRIDSNKHYTKDNVVPCCTTCNFAKNDLPYDKFILWIKKLVAFRNKFYED